MVEHVIDRAVHSFVFVLHNLKVKIVHHQEQQQQLPLDPMAPQRARPSLVSMVEIVTTRVIRISVIADRILLVEIVNQV